MSDDWDRVTVIRKKAPTGKTGKDAIAAAVRVGAEVAVEKKCMRLWIFLFSDSLVVFRIFM
jgi:hypothetical protein